MRLKINRTTTPFVGLLCLLLVSCAEEDVADMYSSPQTKHTRSSFPQSEDSLEDGSSTVSQRTKIALWLAENYNRIEGERVHKAIRNAVSQGLDEVYYLVEYVSPQIETNKISKELPTETSLKLSNICNKNLTNELSSESIAAPEQVSITENLQIYWPYSDEWDGHTPPVIAFAPEDKNATFTTGYKVIGQGSAPQNVIVDEKYCQKYPVWIINDSETPYSLLPNFNKGERISKEGTYYSNSQNTSSKESITSPFPDLVYEGNAPTAVYIGKIRSTTQHDSWLNGGSEYVFRLGALQNTYFTSEADTVKCVPLISKTKICLTRKEIKKGIWKEVNSLAIGDWEKNIRNLILTIVEEDSGKENKSFEAKINVKWSNEEYGFDIGLTFKNHDDWIAERNHPRTFILSSLNREGIGEDGKPIWYEDYSNGVSWTLPFKSGFLITPGWKGTPNP